MRIVSLGGLGDVGRNMTVVEFDGQMLLIDCGVLFPEDDHPGVDLILPGFDAISERLQDVAGLVLTLLTSLAGGAAGPGRMRFVGPDSFEVLVHAGLRLVVDAPHGHHHAADGGPTDHATEPPSPATDPANDLTTDGHDR